MKGLGSLALLAAGFRALNTAVVLVQSRQHRPSHDEEERSEGHDYDSKREHGLDSEGLIIHGAQRTGGDS